MPTDPVDIIVRPTVILPLPLRGLSTLFGARVERHRRSISGRTNAESYRRGYDKTLAGDSRIYRFTHRVVQMLLHQVTVIWVYIPVA